MRSAFALVALAAVAAVVAVQGCGQSCNAMACGEDNLRVEFSSRCWPDGSYEVSGTLDGAPFSVSVELPGAGAVTVDGPVRLEADDAFGIRALGVVGTPGVVEVRIRRGDLVVVEARRTPTYRHEEINGEGCEPVCTTAEESVPVPEAAVNALCDLLDAP
jgi:hypothetical protein